MSLSFSALWIWKEIFNEAISSLALVSLHIAEFPLVRLREATRNSFTSCNDVSGLRQWIDLSFFLFACFFCCCLLHVVVVCSLISQRCTSWMNFLMLLLAGWWIIFRCGFGTGIMFCSLGVVDSSFLTAMPRYLMTKNSTVHFHLRSTNHTNSNFLRRNTKRLYAFFCFILHYVE